MGVYGTLLDNREQVGGTEQRMPKCNHCGSTLASSAMRRSPKGGHICRDKIGCKHDKKIRASGHEPGPRSLQALLRF